MQLDLICQLFENTKMTEVSKVGAGEQQMSPICGPFVGEKKVRGEWLLLCYNC